MHVHYPQLHNLQKMYLVACPQILNFWGLKVRKSHAGFDPVSNTTTSSVNKCTHYDETAHQRLCSVPHDNLNIKIYTKTSFKIMLNVYKTLYAVSF